MEGSAQQPAPDRDQGRTTKATPNKRAKGHTDREGPRHREVEPIQRQPKNTNEYGHREKDNEYTESGNLRNQYNDRTALQSRHSAALRRNRNKTFYYSAGDATAEQDIWNQTEYGAHCRSTSWEAKNGSKGAQP